MRAAAGVRLPIRNAHEPPGSQPGGYYFGKDHSGSMQGCGEVPASATAEEVSMATLAKALNLTPQ